MTPSVFNPLTRQLRKTRCVLSILYLFTGMLLVTALATLLDAAVILSRAGRYFILCLFALGTITGVGYLLGWMMRLPAEKTARWLESINPALGSLLSNAAFFERQRAQEQPHAIQKVLRQRAVAAAGEAVVQIDIPRLLRPKINRAALHLVLLAVLLVAGEFSFSGLFSTTVPRLFHPSADHPPFSRLKLAVTPGDVSVLYADGFDIHVTPSGRPVTQLYLVTQTASGATHRARLFMASDRTFFQTLANIREEMIYYVTDDRARSPKYQVSVRYTPKIKAVTVQLDYPPYTGLPPKQIELSENTFEVVRGTRTQFTVQSNRKLSEGALELTEANATETKRILMSPAASPEAVTAQIIIDKPLVFALTVTDTQGRTCTDPFQGKISLRPDETPGLAIHSPTRQSVATPQSLVPVELEATDDFGIDKIIWFRGINRSIERPKPLAFKPIAGKKNARVDTGIDLKGLGVVPGDCIEFYFEVADNDPLGPNLLTSRPHRIEIISEETYREILKRRQVRNQLFDVYLQLGKQLRRLADRADQLKQMVSEQEAGGERWEVFKKELAAYKNQLEKAKAAPITFDVETAFQKHLTDQGKAVDTLLEKINAHPDPRPSEALLNSIRKTFNRLVTAEAESISKPVKQIKTITRIMAYADMFVSLHQDQNELLHLSRRLADKSGAQLERLERMALRELSVRQGKLGQALSHMMTELYQLRQQIPGDQIFNKLKRSLDLFLVEVNGANIVEDLHQASNHFAALKTAEAIATARRAAENMAMLINRCDNFNGTARQCFQFMPSISKSMGNTLDQIMDAMTGGSGGGPHGYSLFAEQANLYGPQGAMLAGQASGDSPRGPVGGMGKYNLIHSATDERSAVKALSPNVLKQDEIWVPAQYRRMADAYFRSIAEEAE